MPNLSTGQTAYVMTGPTSGIGLQTALALARRAPVVLVGRDRLRLEKAQRDIAAAGGTAAAIVVCDLADLDSVRSAADEIVGLGVPLAGLLNNAGIMQTSKSTARSAQGFDLTFATNYLGPMLLTEALVPRLVDGAQVLSVVSAIEDPERRPAKVMGMRGGRYISAEASARGEWLSGGARLPGIDAYATSKQALLAASLALARCDQRLRFNAVEPGITPGTGLGGGGAVASFIFGQIITRLPPFSQYRSTPEKAAGMITDALTNASIGSGIYLDERGRPMNPSERARDPAFQDRVLAETRALLTPYMARH